MKLLCVFILALLTSLLLACTPAPTASSPTAVAIVRELATVFISPTPNAQQSEATRRAATPTPMTPTPTMVPTSTPYVGVFIGQAQRDEGFTNYVAPLFESASNVGAGQPRFVTQCEIGIQTESASLWLNNTNVQTRLGCPIQESFGWFGDIQVFEGGQMYHNPNTDEVWAILPGENNQGTYYALQNPTAEANIPTVPLNRVSPRGIFARMWASVEGLSILIGYGLDVPIDVSVNIQRFDGGTIFYDVTSEQIFVLLVDGTLLGPFAPVIPPPTATPAPTEELPEGEGES